MVLFFDGFEVLVLGSEITPLVCFWTFFICLCFFFRILGDGRSKILLSWRRCFFVPIGWSPPGAESRAGRTK